MPTRMNGVEAGTTTRTKMVPSFAPSTRAAFSRVRSTCTTPWKVEITQARIEARKITKILGCSPMPISTIASGMIASGGMVRKNCTHGSSSPRPGVPAHEEPDRDRQGGAQEESAEHADQRGDDVLRQGAGGGEVDRGQHHLGRARDLQAHEGQQPPQPEAEEDRDDVEDPQARSEERRAGQARRDGVLAA